MAIQRYYYSENDPLPDVYQYTSIPEKAATQIQFIFDKYFRQDFQYPQKERIFTQIYQTLKEELGLTHSPQPPCSSWQTYPLYH